MNLSQLRRLVATKHPQDKLEQQFIHLMQVFPEGGPGVVKDLKEEPYPDWTPDFTIYVHDELFQLILQKNLTSDPNPKQPSESELVGPCSLYLVPPITLLKAESSRSKRSRICFPGQHRNSTGCHRSGKIPRCAFQGALLNI